MDIQFLRKRLGVAAVMGHTRATILGLILDAQRQGRCLTNRELCKAVGTHVNALVHHLAALKREGLITSDAWKARTIRPACRFVPVDQLGREP